MHYLKVTLYFDRTGYRYYRIYDGGYELPEEQPYIHKRYAKGSTMKAYSIWVEDAGKRFDIYAEEALEHYENWCKAGHSLFERKERCNAGSNRKVQKKSGVGK